MPFPCVQAPVQAHQLFVIVFRCCLVHNVCQIAKGKDREEIWLSVSYLFISTSLIYGKNQQVRQGVVCPKDLKRVFRLRVRTA